MLKRSKAGRRPGAAEEQEMRSRGPNGLDRRRVAGLTRPNASI
jgi:hypothetical protein